MKRPVVWFKWLFWTLVNAAVALYLASAIGVSLLIVTLVLILLDGVPLLWKVGIIPHTVFVAADFIGGLWFIIQAAVLIFDVYAVFVLFCILGGWGIVASFAFILVAGCLLYVRSRRAVGILS